MDSWLTAMSGVKLTLWNVLARKDVLPTLYIRAPTK